MDLPKVSHSDLARPMERFNPDVTDVSWKAKEWISDTAIKTFE